MAPRLLERLLRHVLRGARVARDGQGHAEDDPLEAAHERDRQLRLARAKPSEQPLIGLPVW
jgi:hypothetical protein